MLTADNVFNGPPPLFAVSINSADPLVAFLAPAFLFFALSPDELGSNVELFTYEPFVFDVADTAVAATARRKEVVFMAGR